MKEEKKMEKTSQTRLGSAFENYKIITLVLLLVGLGMYAYSELNILNLERFDVLSLGVIEGILLVTVIIITLLYSNLDTVRPWVFIGMLVYLIITSPYEHSNSGFKIAHVLLYLASIIFFIFSKRKKE